MAVSIDDDEVHGEAPFKRQRIDDSGDEERDDESNDQSDDGAENETHQRRDADGEDERRAGSNSENENDSNATSFRINDYFTHAESTTQPRMLTELHLLHGVGAVLDKPQWWLKWQQHPEVREKWLDEIECAFLVRTFMSIFKWWPIAHDRCKLFRAVRNALTAETNEERQHLLDAACARVDYRTIWLGYWERSRTGSDEDEEWTAADDGHGEEDDDSTASDDESARAVELQSQDELLEKMNETFTLPPLNPYGQVGWYMHQWSRIQRVVGVGAEALPLDGVIDEIFGRDRHILDESTRVRNDYEAFGYADDDPEELVQADFRDAKEAARVVFALRGQGNLTLEALREAIGNPDESREEVLWQLLQYVAQIHGELDKVRSFVEEYVNQILHRCRLRLCDIKKDRNPPRVTWGAVEETFVSDELISEELKNKFVTELRALEDVPPDQLDWHPRSNNQVLDLVHPSLYCGVFNVTKYVPSDPSTDLASGNDLASLFLALLIRTETAGRPLHADHFYRSHNFQWLPSDFEISESGDTCHIRSYINNLHPSDHKDLYQSIEQIFARFVPLFENVLTSLTGPVATTLITDEYDDRYPLSGLPDRPSIPRHVELNRPEMPHVSLAGQTLQVIVKIAEIVLTPEKPTYGGGSWHIEGTSFERIVATGVYYCTNDNITTSKLAFRTSVDTPPYIQNDNLGVEVTYGFTSDQALVQPLGAVTTYENRCLVFPNTLQHQVQPFELVDKTKPGVRKILCFFLIDPSRRIPSTAEIAPQQRAWILRARREQLQQTRLQSDIPEPVQQQILEMAYSQGMTLEQAKTYRLKLMDERKSDALEGDNVVGAFNLCEH